MSKNSPVLRCLREDKSASEVAREESKVTDSPTMFFLDSKGAEASTWPSLRTLSERFFSSSPRC
jgi:hypothetical protein